VIHRYNIIGIIKIGIIIEIEIIDRRIDIIIEITKIK
jgi:hypothetical protein